MATEESKIPTDANPNLAGTGVWVIPLKCGQYNCSCIVLGRCECLNTGEEAKTHDLAEETSANGFSCELLLLLGWKVAWLERAAM